MKGKRFISLLGVLSLSLTLGLASGGIAEAKKKKKKGGARVTVQTKAPVTLPPASGGIGSLTDIPLKVGKRAKGKVISRNTVIPTVALVGPPGFALGLDLELVAPNGFVITLPTPDDPDADSIGPLSWSPNVHSFLCPGVVACSNPKHNVMRPYLGTVNQSLLGLFAGLRATGTWHLLAVNQSQFVATVVLWRLLLGLQEPVEVA